MADRLGRIKIIEDTLRACKDNTRLKESVTQSISRQVIYWEDDEAQNLKMEKCIDQISTHDDYTSYLISTDRTFEAAARYTNEEKKIAVLNFASSVTPGGGVLRGTTAQEESLCRISTLYPCLIDEKTATPFYDKHRKLIRSYEMGRENRDDCIYTPDVTVFRRDTFDCEMMDEEEWYTVDVITCAAPDLRYDVTGKRFDPTDDELLEIFEKRWKKIFRVAICNNVKILILGAFGCGAFGNSSDLVAKAANSVRSLYNKADMLETVEFAIYESSSKGANYMGFRNNIKGLIEI